VVICVVLLRLQLNNHDADSGKIVLIEDSNSDNYVAIGEVMASDYTPEWLEDATSAGGHKIRVILKSVTKPETILPFEVQDQYGRVVCRTLGEVFLKKKGVLWLQRDTVLTQPDGCTIIEWAWFSMSNICQCTHIDSEFSFNIYRKICSRHFSFFLLCATICGRRCILHVLGLYESYCECEVWRSVSFSTALFFYVC
jgi:hypothetical protein